MNGKAARRLREQEGPKNRRAKRVWARMSQEQRERRIAWYEGGREALLRRMAQERAK